MACTHPLSQKGYNFVVVAPASIDDAGTGFVHTAPGHGREDFEVWTANRAVRNAASIRDPLIPDENGAFTEAPPALPASASSTQG
jgi:isoleucyl-tRNA synthetase